MKTQNSSVSVCQSLGVSLGRHIAIFLLAVLCAAGPVGQARAVTVLTWNVEGTGTSGSGWDPSTAKVSAMGHIIQAVGPDIYGFCEYVLESDLSYTTLFASTFTPGFYVANNSYTAGHINVIFSRYPITRSQSHLGGCDLTQWGGTGTWGCDLFEAEVAVPGWSRHLHVFLTHLTAGAGSSNDAERHAESLAISNYLHTTYLSTYPADPYIVMGDLNSDCAYHTETIPVLVSPGTGLQLTSPGLTGDPSCLKTEPTGSGLPQYRLDYMLPGKLSMPVWEQVYSNANCVTASDHYPVVEQYFRDISEPLVLVGNNGAQAAFAMFPDGTVNMTAQSTAGGTWSSWTTNIGNGSGFKNLSGVVLSDGTMAIYGCGGGAVYKSQQSQPGGAFSSWTPVSVGDGFMRVKALAFNDDTMAIVGCGDGGSVWYTAQSTKGGTWPAWQEIPGNTGVLALDAVVLANQAMCVFACGGGTVWGANQTVKGGSFGSWASVGNGSGFTQVKAIRFNDNHMGVLGCGDGTYVYWSEQTAPGGGYSGWSQVPGSTGFTTIGAVLNTNQCVSAFGCGGGAVYISSQSTFRASFPNWSSLLGSGFYEITPAVITTGGMSGAMSVFGGSPTSPLWEKGQSVFGGSWSGWTNSGGTLE